MAGACNSQAATRWLLPWRGGGATLPPEPKHVVPVHISTHTRGILGDNLISCLFYNTTAALPAADDQVTFAREKRGLPPAPPPLWRTVDLFVLGGHDSVDVEAQHMRQRIYFLADDDAHNALSRKRKRHLLQDNKYSSWFSCIHALLCYGLFWTVPHWVAHLLGLPTTPTGWHYLPIYYLLHSPCLLLPVLLVYHPHLHTVPPQPTPRALYPPPTWPTGCHPFPHLDYRFCPPTRRCGSYRK